jgi:hypothetical protein
MDGRRSVAVVGEARISALEIFPPCFKDLERTLVTVPLPKRVSQTRFDHGYAVTSVRYLSVEAPPPVPESR